jgi:Transcription factor subunit Med10 of Mediator complex
LNCSLIDDGKNPDEFTRNVINSCIAKNQITKGKTDAFKVTFPHLQLWPNIIFYLVENTLVFLKL